MAQRRSPGRWTTKVLVAGIATAASLQLGATTAAAAEPPLVPGPTQSVVGSFVPIPGDFDGDGRDDILWYRPGTGRDHLWRGTAGGFAEAGRVNIDGNYTPIAGDFDGDGRDDILWNGFGTAPDPLWRGTPTGFSAGPTQKINGWYAAIVGDYDGDTRDDILWYRAGAWPDYLWRGTTDGFVKGPRVSIVGTYRPESGDFDGDGRDDIYWDTQRLGAPDPTWRGAAGSTAFVPGPTVPFTDFWADSVPGDFDGNGTTDLLWFNWNEDAEVRRGTSEGFGPVPESASEVAEWGDPVPGDFDGDGRGDLLWYRAGPDPDLLWRGN